MYEITISAAPIGTVTAATIDDQWAAELSRRGFDPHDYNRVTWPTGASRWASAKLLFRRYQLQLFIDTAGGIDAPVSLSFAGMQFDKMYLRAPRQKLLTHDSGQYVVAELVDARYFWNNPSPSLGFNVPTDLKEIANTLESYVETLAAGETPYTFQQIIEVLEGQLGSISPPTDFQPIDPEVLGGNNAEHDRLSGQGPSDLAVEGMGVGDLIDRVLATAGYALMARTSQQPAAWRYEFVPLEVGHSRALGQLQSFGGEIVAGGLWTGSEDLPDPPLDVYVAPPPPAPPAGGGPKFEAKGIGQTAEPGPGAPEPAFYQLAVQRIADLDAECPTLVSVNFPTALDVPSQYRFDPTVTALRDGLDYVLRRYYTTTSSAGRPAGVTGDGSVVALFDSTWARYEIEPGSDPLTTNVLNEAELLARADLAATAYFGRFRAGVGDVLFIGALDLVQWPGASEITWSLLTWGPQDRQNAYTRARGQLHDPIFGWRTDAPLTASRVLSTGRVRAIPRPDGGLLIDSPGVARALLHSARVTEVNGDAQDPPLDTFNPVYTAVAEDDPSLSIVDAAPENRNIPGLDYYSRLLGDHCIIIEQPSSGTLALWIFEVPVLVTCPPLPSPAIDQALLSAHGM